MIKIRMISTHGKLARESEGGGGGVKRGRREGVSHTTRALSLLGKNEYKCVSIYIQCC